MIVVGALLFLFKLTGIGVHISISVIGVLLLLSLVAFANYPVSEYGKSRCQKNHKSYIKKRVLHNLRSKLCNTLFSVA